MVVVAIVLGGIVAGVVMWALDQRPVRVRREDYSLPEWNALWMERWKE